MVNDRYWVFIQSIFGYGSDKPAKILEQFDNIKNFFRSNSEWENLKFITNSQLIKLNNHDLSKTDACINYCRIHNIRIYTLED